jgi:uncharacterized membrane protein YfcA
MAVLRLIAIGLVAGFFSALFGVGGGVVVVPLLIYSGLTPRTATGTSLTAVFLIALAGAVSYGFHGELKPGAAAIVGLPAALGAVAGAALQQRVTTRALVLAFALLLAVIGLRLVV